MTTTRVRKLRRKSGTRKQRGGWPTLSCFGGKCAVNATAQGPPTIKNPLSSIPQGPLIYGQGEPLANNVNPIAKINSNVFAKEQIKQLLNSIQDKRGRMASAPEQMVPKIMETMKLDILRLQRHIDIYVDRFSREYNYASVSSKMTAKKYNKPEIQGLLNRIIAVRRVFPIQIKERKAITGPSRNNIIGPLNTASKNSKPSFTAYRHAYILENILNILEPMMDEIHIVDMPGSPANSGDEANA
jgi:hypothetical protein